MYAWMMYTSLFDSMISTNAYLISIDLDICHVTMSLQYFNTWRPFYRLLNMAQINKNYSTCANIGG